MVFTDSGSLNLIAKTHLNDKQESTIDIEGQIENMNKMIHVSLEKLDDPMVNELFISAINLMKYFCLEGSKEENDGNQYLDKVASSLNANNRETALFNCLKINSDDVKLAVVDCLFCIEIS